MFQGQRAFHTNDPVQLQTELMRQNAQIEAEFKRLDGEKPSRWNVRRETGSTAQAAHGDFILAGFNQNAQVLLPASSPAKAGHAVRVAQVGGIGAVTIVAQRANSVNATTSVAIGVNTGFHEYVDDGAGGWWGPAV